MGSIEAQLLQLLVQPFSVHSGFPALMLSRVEAKALRAEAEAGKASTRATGVAMKGAMLGELEGIEMIVGRELCWSLERLLGHIAGRRDRGFVVGETVQYIFAQSGALRERVSGGSAGVGDLICCEAERI